MSERWKSWQLPSPSNMGHSWPWSAVTSVGAPRTTAATARHHKLAGTQRPSTQSWWRANGADLLWKRWRLAEGGARRFWSSWQKWHPLAHGTHHRCCDAQRFFRGGKSGQRCCQCRVPGQSRLRWSRVTPTLWAGVCGSAPDLDF